MLGFILVPEKSRFAAGRHEAGALISGDGIPSPALWKAEHAPFLMELNALAAPETGARHQKGSESSACAGVLVI